MSLGARYYRLLLRLLPRDFREACGPDMLAVFDEMRRERVSRGLLRPRWTSTSASPWTSSSVSRRRERASIAASAARPERTRDRWRDATEGDRAA